MPHKAWRRRPAQSHPHRAGLRESSQGAPTLVIARKPADSAPTGSGERGEDQRSSSGSLAMLAVTPCLVAGEAMGAAQRRGLTYQVIRLR